MRITLGTVQREYATMRNVLAPAVPDVERVRASNIFRYPNHALYKAFGYVDPMLGHLHWGWRDCDLLHFFNMVSLGRTPWITTFETTLPRWDYHMPGAIPAGLRLLAGPACRRLIAISDCTAEFQRSAMAAHPALADAIDAKITVLHPPQLPLIEDKGAAWADMAPIRFAIVGSLFFVKGGREILRAFDRLLARGAPVQLTIVSTLTYGDDESCSTRADQDEARALIARWPGRIFHHERLDNEAVLELFRHSHVALLPSWADTYGYVVIEAQAAGCPVVTTDVRAMPEINDDTIGWVIRIPKDARGTADIHTPEQRARLSRLIDGEIERIVDEIVADPAAIPAKGAAALAKIRARHDPQAHAQRLREIYEEALA